MYSHRFFAIALGLSVSQMLPAAQPAGIEFFESKIRPVLVQHCYSCHSKDAKRLRGGLRLDTREGVLRGGDSGKIIVPGKPSESLLIQALRHRGEPAMPPKGKLPDSVIADFERWIALGAPDPRRETAVSRRLSNAPDDREDFWAFRPLTKPAIPTVDSPWPHNEVDHFILDKLQSKGLAPAEDADRFVLLRRVYFDLIGLPPTPEQLEAFARDKSPDAFAKVVDRLLASPHFGERWGRHWLDLARYADSNGGDINATYTNAWRYRDYVIEAFNEDKPYDEFVIEQLAGDLLPAKTDAERDEQLIATGFLVLGAKMLSERDKEKLRMDVVDEQIDTVGRVFLGLTLGCARCHEHKFDPIPVEDYYALAGIFRSTLTISGSILGNVVISGWSKQRLSMPPELAAKRQELEKQLAQYTAQKTEAQQLLASLKKQKKNTADTEAKLKELIGRIDELKRKMPPIPMAMAVRDVPSPSDCRITIRGNVHRLGKTVPRGFLTLFEDGTIQPTIDPSTSGRLELARWLVRTPLVPRVMVNRIWHHLFGAGLVRSVDDFGNRGDRPSHPELLDYLAGKFVEEHWSVKKMIRRLVLSRTYQLSTHATPLAKAKDPENIWFGRRNRRHLDAESLRDAMLAISGVLDQKQGGSTIAGIGDKARRRSTEAFFRRSIYLPIIRTDVEPMLEIFDFPNPGMVTGRRAVTNVPAQALFLLNSPFVRQRSEETVNQIMAHAGSTEERIEAAYLRIVNRRPSAAEQAKALAFFKAISESEEIAREGWVDFCQALFASTQFRFVE
ncbi:MAG: hypothetical protein KatS3mg105_0910 [Gemmatales bacterium]|nr:MAG: hypothetical protein KatS3mg105_0910 [Gemmatales bacterium]